MMGTLKKLSVALILVTWGAACADKSAQQDGRTGKSDPNTPSSGDNTTTGGDTTRDSAGTNTADSGKGMGDPTFNSKNYYDTVILPLFQSDAMACQTCHAGPRVPVDPRGPLTIFNFDAMETMLKTGDTFGKSALLLKVMSKTPHGGGDRCGGDVAQAPCAQIKTWWEGLFGPATDPNQIGIFVSSRYDGTVQGWAVNPADKATPVKVTLYLNAPKDSGGVLLSEVTANSPGLDGGNGGTHAFSYQIPQDKWTSGQEVKVYGYATIGTQVMEIDSSPKTFKVYRPKDPNYYTTNIAPQVGACAGCHTNSVVAWYSSLISPQPDQGGTATTNVLRVKSGGGDSHSGGNQCGGNATLCTNIEAWWNFEFGP